MHTTLTVEAKVIGQAKSRLQGAAIPFDATGIVTLEDLISRIVIEEVKAFRERQEGRQLIRFLSAEQIADGAAQGKIEMGGSQVGIQNVDEQAAVANALQAFRDGIYLAFVNGQQVQRLDAELELKPETSVSFVRLMMLAGG